MASPQGEGIVAGVLFYISRKGCDKRAELGKTRRTTAMRYTERYAHCRRPAILPSSVRLACPTSVPERSFVPQLSHEIFHKKLIFCRCASANRAAEPSFFLLSDSIASRSCALSCHVFSSPWCAKLLPYGPLPRGRYRPAILFIAFSKTDAPEAPALSQQKMRPSIERMVNASFFDFAT